MNVTKNGSGISRGTIVACIVLTVIGFLIYTGHGAHALGYFPYLLILACPLMHLFMHGSHGHGDHHNSAGGSDCCSSHGGSNGKKHPTKPMGADGKGDQL